MKKEERFGEVCALYLQEYIVEESLGIKKGDFLRRAVAFHSVKNPHVIRLDSIFFVKVSVTYCEHVEVRENCFE